MRIIIIETSTTSSHIQAHLQQNMQDEATTYIIHQDTPHEIIQLIAVSTDEGDIIEFIPKIPIETMLMTAAILKPGTGIMPPVDISADNMRLLAANIQAETHLHVHRAISEDLIKIAASTLKPGAVLTIEQGCPPAFVKTALQVLPINTALKVSSQEHSKEFVERIFTQAFPGGDRKLKITRVSSTKSTEKKDHLISPFFQNKRSRTPADFEAAESLVLLSQTI